MTTPILDFVRQYVESGAARLHMPGHKGRGILGCEALDITEIEGADWLYGPSGIIRESEENAARLFGTGQTLYSTEGSSLCVRAMLYLAAARFRRGRPNERPAVIAGRNAHTSFLTAAALLDLDVVWLWPEGEDYALCRCRITPDALREALEKTKNAAAVFLTSPDYLGNLLDIRALRAAAKDFGVPLLVDNAHGAYLRFLEASRHPMDQGADLCCDSAHKTLPVLTGGAYLHIGRSAPESFMEEGEEAMALFGSTSPSYLILQSLDGANPLLAGEYPERLRETAGRLSGLKERLSQRGWTFLGDEPCKLTLSAGDFGYTGEELSARLRERGIECEYADPDYLVLMPAPGNRAEDWLRLEAALGEIPRRERKRTGPPGFSPPERRLSLREALFSPRESVPVEESLGRVAAGLTAGCPPAVAPVAAGEVIHEAARDVLRYYGHREILVLKE